MDKNTLTKVGKWAQTRVAEGQEPPWTYHKLKELAELALELAEGMDATAAMDLSDPYELDDVSELEDSEVGGEVVQLDDFRKVSSEPDVNLPV